MTLGLAILAAVLSLNGTWDLSYFRQPEAAPVRDLPVPPSVEMRRVPATVPGNCELDLVRAGLAPDPEIGTNSYAFRKWEGYQWLYTKTFTFHSTPTPSLYTYHIVFEGVDTFADVFLNGKKIGECANMLIPHRFDVTGTLRTGENTLQVLIRSAFMETRDKTLGELGRTMTPGAEGELIRKAAHMGGWDIFPRLFASGLWRGVSLVTESRTKIDQTSYFVSAVDVANRQAKVSARFRISAPFDEIDRAKVRMTLSRNGRTAYTSEKTFRHYHNELRFALSDVDFWWPRGMGEAALYDALLELVGSDGKILAEKREKIGIRTIRLKREDRVPGKSDGEFVFLVNGEKCFIRGTNWVPMDAFHGRDAAHLAETQEMLADLNCNMVRMWGGGVYEPDSFYDFCDREGVMVWQDLMTASGLYPQSDAYAALTREELIDVVLRLRNHPALALWSGNNENDFAPEWNFGKGVIDPNRDRTSRRTIPEVLYEFDLSRDYLPSSPYMSEAVFRGEARHVEEHIWDRCYYKDPKYVANDFRFVSEMGYHGCPSRESLERMMTKDRVYPWIGETWHWNDEWQCKACVPFDDPDHELVTRNDHLLKKIRFVFGEVSRDLNTFIAQSQFVQAEALKTWIECYRMDKFRGKNGLLWWNLRDGWPIISDAVVDYYGNRKMAYAAIRSVQQDHLVAMKDDGSIWAVNDTRHPVGGHASLVDEKSGRTLAEIDYKVPANDAVKVGSVELNGQGFVMIRWTCDGMNGENRFLYGRPPFDLSILNAAKRN